MIQVCGLREKQLVKQHRAVLKWIRLRWTKLPAARDGDMLRCILPGDSGRNLFFFSRKHRCCRVVVFLQPHAFPTDAELAERKPSQGRWCTFLSLEKEREEVTLYGSRSMIALAITIGQLPPAAGTTHRSHRQTVLQGISNSSRTRLFAHYYCKM